MMPLTGVSARVSGHQKTYFSGTAAVTQCPVRGEKERESGASEGATQVIVGIAVLSGKARTAETNDVLDLSGGEAQR